MKTTAIALLALVCALPVAAQGQNFDADFLDRTMRIDYIHVGNASEEFITLDRIFSQGSWAGSRTHLIDLFNLGRYSAKVYDAASKNLLFSRGFDAFFGEYRTTQPASEGVRRAYHESVLIPFPKNKIRLVIEARGNDKKLKEIASFEIDPAGYEIVRKPLSEGVKVFRPVTGGDPHNHVDVAILGEGYTLAEEGKFKSDLERFVAVLLGAEPYKSKKDRFNIYGVLKPSQESGCDEPSYGSYKNTSLGASFDSFGSERYMLVEDNRTMRDIAAHVPYDTVLIMVNSSRYGGGGIYNLYCTFTADNQWHAYLLLHEFGHSFTGLADEYYTSQVAYNEFYPKGIEPNEPNITALLDPTNIKWKSIVTTGTAIPTPWEKAYYDSQDRAYQKVRQELNQKIAKAKREGRPKEEVAKLQEEAERLSRENQASLDAFLAKSKYVGQVGAFEGAGYAAEGLYRPMLDCLMFSKGAKPLCRVCQAAVARVIDYYGE